MAQLKIAITGGPSGGKTTLIEALQKDSADLIALVPEAASILYRGGFPRKKSLAARKCAQKAIYYTQMELEDLVAAESSAKIIVCDRGSLDSIAYWPEEDSSDFFAAVSSNRQVELSRYQWVLHLDTADQSTFDTTNPIRTESHREAVELNSKIKDAWSGHPQRVIIPHEDEFLLKILRAKSAIKMMLAGKTFDAIQTKLNALSLQEINDIKL